MMLKNIFVLCSIIINAYAIPFDDNWQGKWFPHSPNEPDLNPSVNSDKQNKHDLYDPNHGVVMGIENPDCDDAKSHLNVDWNMNPENTTCYEDKKLYLPDSTLHPIYSSQNIPSAYSAVHKCMNESITYNHYIPTFGTHRPLWAQYGEYAFLPKQRWLHNLEHGALVFLYHPCANYNQVNLVKKLVKSCLYRHIITPYNLLTKQRPLALVTWGNRLEISKVAPEVIIDFIKSHALRGPEKVSRDGQYTFMMKEHAKTVSDINDIELCPLLEKKKANISMK